MQIRDVKKELEILEKLSEDIHIVFSKHLNGLEEFMVASLVSSAIPGITAYLINSMESFSLKNKQFYLKHLFKVARSILIQGHNGKIAEKVLLQ